MLVKAVNDWESDDLVDILSSSMLKVDIRARKTASECLEQVKYLHRAPSLLRDLDRGSVTSTDVMSSSIIFEARRELERAEGADRVNEVEVNLRSPDEHQTTLKSARSYRFPQPTSGESPSHCRTTDKRYRLV